MLYHQQYRYYRLAFVSMLMALLCLLCACAPQSAALPTPAPSQTPAPIRATPAATPEPSAALEFPPPPQPAATPAVATPVEAPALPLSGYEVAMELLPAQDLLVCAMRLHYVNAAEEPLYDLYLHLFPNAFATEEQLDAAEIARDYPEGFMPGGLSIKELTLADAPADYELRENGEFVRIPLSSPLAPGETAVLYMAYTVAIPQKNGMFGKTELGYQLAYCIPTAAVYENGAWDTRIRPAIGDALYTACADYRVAFTRPKGYTVAASGKQMREEAEGDKLTSYYAMANTRDFCLCASRDYTLHTEPLNTGAQVLSYAMTEESARLSARVARDMLNDYGERLMPYPYETLTVVQTALGSWGGMEFPGLVMIERAAYLDGMTAQRTWLIAHECAHQWFYAAVGNDQLAEPWLDEALADTLALEGVMHMMNAADANAFSVISADAAPEYAVDGSVYDYPDAETYNDAVYKRGAYAMQELKEHIGAEAFYAGLSQYCERHMFGIARKSDLISAMSDAAKQDLTDWFSAALAPLTPAA